MSVNVFRSAKKHPLILEIYKFFIAPYIKYMKIHCWPHTSAEQMLEHFFHLSERKIVSAIVLNPFELPGKYVIQEAYQIGTGGPRNLAKGQKLLIRTDESLPRVDIEVIMNDESEELRSYVFYLTQSEFKSIKSYIKIKDAHG